MGKETADELYARTDKGHVCHTFVERFGGSGPHACAFDVDADKVFLGKSACQTDSVFSASAAEFKHDGMVVLEELPVPRAFQGKRSIEWLAFCRLEDVGIAGHVGEFLQFVFGHVGLGFFYVGDIIPLVARWLERERFPCR